MKRILKKLKFFFFIISIIIKVIIFIFFPEMSICIIFKFFMMLFKPFFIGFLVVSFAGIREKKIVSAKILRNNTIPGYSPDKINRDVQYYNTQNQQSERRISTDAQEYTCHRNEHYYRQEKERNVSACSMIGINIFMPPDL